MPDLRSEEIKGVKVIEDSNELVILPEKGLTEKDKELAGHEGGKAIEYQVKSGMEHEEIPFDYIRNYLTTNKSNDQVNNLPGEYILGKMKIEQIVLKAESLGYPLPSSEVSEAFLQLFYQINSAGFDLYYLNPSEEGGVVLEFGNEAYYYMAEIFNDSELAILKKDLNSRDKEGMELKINAEGYLGKLIDFLT